MTLISKNVYIHKWDEMRWDIVNKYKNTYHITIKMKLVGLESNTFIASSKRNQQ